MVKISPAPQGGGLWLGHGKAPVDYSAHYPPPEGKGELKYSMYGGEPMEDYPEGCDYLVKMKWSNYQDQPNFKLFPNHEENLQMWQEIERDRQLDTQPVHEIYASELPDYHYWPMIQNDIGPKRAMDTDQSYQYEFDQTKIPRFHKNGVPKTPPHEQLWYLPRTADGRFNWRLNAIVNNRNLVAYCSEEGWNARYLRRIFRPWLGGRSRSRASNVYQPIYFRHIELPQARRTFRWLKGSYVSTAWFFVPLYSSMLAYAGSMVGDYRAWNWCLDGPWNPDYTVLALLARNRGAYHGII